MASFYQAIINIIKEETLNKYITKEAEIYKLTKKIKQQSVYHKIKCNKIVRHCLAAHLIIVLTTK